MPRNDKHHILENLTRLTAKQQRLLDMLSVKNHAQMTRKPTDNTWSCAQLIDHMMMSERLTLMYLQKKVQGIDTVGRANLLTHFRFFIFQVGMHFPIKFKAPKPISNPSNEWDIEKIKKKWVAVHDDMSHFIQEYPVAHLNKVIFKHPIAGRITLAQTVTFFHLHFDRHHKQLLDRLPG